MITAGRQGKGAALRWILDAAPTACGSGRPVGTRPDPALRAMTCGHAIYALHPSRKASAVAEAMADRSETGPRPVAPSGLSMASPRRFRKERDVRAPNSEHEH
jgi:hypothetical protein